jgi:hypothetical protein
MTAVDWLRESLNLFSNFDLSPSCEDFESKQHGLTVRVDLKVGDFSDECISVERHNSLKTELNPLPLLVGECNKGTGDKKRRRSNSISTPNPSNNKITFLEQNGGMRKMQKTKPYHFTFARYDI